MGFKRYTVSNIRNVRLTVPGFGTGGGAAPLTPGVGVQVFTGSSTWTVPTGVSTIDYLVVAGGGGGSELNGGGGGGAGGYLAGTSYPVTPGSVYTIAVGAGGGTNANGSNSSLTATSPVANIAVCIDRKSVV